MFRTPVAFAGAALLSLALAPFSSFAQIAQTVTVSTLYTFSGTDGNGPDTLLQGSDGNFYGTTLYGGSTAPTAIYPSGVGTIFKMTPAGALTVLYNFTGGNDGAFPESLIEGSDGNVYGTAVFGGSGGCHTGSPTDMGGSGYTSWGCGTIFQLTPTGNFTLLYTFTDGGDGAYPVAVVEGSDGNLYGTAAIGGTDTAGTIFRIPMTGGSTTTLYSFTGGSDGGVPFALLQGSDGNFYGTTEFGGNLPDCLEPAPDGKEVSVGCGTIFEITASGSFSTLYAFTGGSDGTNNAARSKPEIIIQQPSDGREQGYQSSFLVLPISLVEGSSGSFYGTTTTTPNVTPINPIIFAVTPSGEFTTLYTGVSDLSLIPVSDGNYYGPGFYITPGGSFTTLTFTGGSDAGAPGGAIQGSDGNLYSVNGSGGDLADCGGTGCGTVFKLIFSPGLPAPLNITLSSNTIVIGSSVTITWSVSNDFSTTFQQCNAFVQDGATGAGNWTGPQAGALSDGLYTGSTNLTPTVPGTYTYALTCGGQESGFATLTVTAPTASFSPPNLTFSSQALSTTSPSQAVTLSNNGTGALNIASIAASGDFGATNTCNGSVAVGSSCSINVTFTPTAIGTRTGTLTITDNASGSPQTVSLSGTGSGPSVALSTASLSFASQLVSSTSAAQSVTLTNSGNAALSISSIALSGANAGEFAQTPTCGSSLAAGANCTISVTFTPKASGSSTASLNITDNGLGSPQTITLSGSGEDFSLGTASGSGSSATVAPGSTASYNLSVAPAGGLAGTVSVTCSGAPSEATCSASPASLSLNGSGSSSTTISVTTTAASLVSPRLRLRPPAAPGGRILTLAVVIMALLGAMAVLTLRRVPGARRVPLGVALASLLLISACGGGGGGGGGGCNTNCNPGTPPGTYNLTVTATYASGSTTVQHTTTLSLAVS